MKKTKKLLLWLSLGLLVMVNQVGLMAAREWKVVDEKPADAVSVVTTKLINETKYKLWLQTDAIGIPRNSSGLFGYRPLGSIWVNQGESREDRSANYAPEGKAYIYWTSELNPGMTTTGEYLTLDLNGKSDTFDLPKFKVEIKAKPVQMYYPPIAVPFGTGKAYVYEFYDYTITVTGKEKEK